MKLNREGVQLNAEERNKRNQNWATLEVELDGIGEKIADGGDAKELAENVQAQVNALVVQGDSSVEARQARVDAKGVEAATLKARLDAEQNAVTAQLAGTVKKDEGGVINYSMLSQDVREQFTGGNTAVVGVDSVLTENIVNGAVTTSKLNFKPVFGEVGKNLFNRGAVTLGHYVNHLTGAIVAGNSTSFSVSEYIQVQPNTTYIKVYEGRAAFYTAEKVFISGSFSSKTLTTPANCYFLRMDILPENLGSEQLETGLSNTSYEPFGYFLGGNVKANAIKAEHLAESYVKAESGKNLFDKSKAIPDYYVNHLTGALVVSNDKSFAVSSFIPVDANTAYTRKFKQRLAFYDANKIYISGSFDSLTVTSPNNAVFVRFEILKTNLNTEQFEKGTSSTNYEAFRWVAGTSSLKDGSITREKLDSELLNELSNGDFSILSGLLTTQDQPWEVI